MDTSSPQLLSTGLLYHLNKTVSSENRIKKAFLKPLRLALPTLSFEMLQMSLLRFSTEAYAFKKKNKVLDFLFSLFAILGIAFFLLFKSRFRKKGAGRVDIHFDCGDTTYYEKHFSKIEEALSGITCRRAGMGDKMDIPPMDNHFAINEASRAAFFIILLGPYLLLLSLISRINYIRSFLRTSVVYCRGRYYFSKYPAKLFLTYADNSCSPAFYSAFKSSGGEFFCAFQNGIRFADEGIDYACFDHFFTIGKSSIETYQQRNAMIQHWTEIGSLSFGNNLHLLKNDTKTLYDVMFIDQGFPFKNMYFWGTAGPEVVSPFFDYIRKFSQERNDLRLVYQMRHYEGSNQAMGDKIKEWFANYPVKLLDGCTSVQSYNTLATSLVIVTMCSTLGLAGLLMGKPVLFFNFTQNPTYNVVTGPLQETGCNYKQFKNKIENVLKNKIGLDHIEVNHYISSNSLKSSSIIANNLRNHLLKLDNNPRKLYDNT